MKKIMNKFELLIAWLATHASALNRFLGSMTVSIILGIPTLFLFGDTLLSLLGHALAVLGHGLHVLFEIFESITGHILEEAFHLHKRTAEIVFFWISMAVAIGLSWYISRKGSGRGNGIAPATSPTPPVMRFSATAVESYSLCCREFRRHT